MAPKKLFLDVAVKMKVDITKKTIHWWMVPRAGIAFFLIRLGCRIAGAEVIVHEQPGDWDKKPAEINIESFMRP